MKNGFDMNFPTIRDELKDAYVIFSWLFARGFIYIERSRKRKHYDKLFPPLVCTSRLFEPKKRNLAPKLTK